jgi:hypothetical protein
MLLAVILFILSISGAAFTLIWKNVLSKTQQDYIDTLTKNEREFKPDTIEMLSAVNKKIDTSEQLLNNHLAPVEIFNIVGQLTAEHIRFSSLEFTAPITKKDGVIITMRGEGNSFKDIAFQSDVFGQSVQYGTNKVIKNPILSDLGVNQNGNISFTFTTNIDAGDISYAKVLEQTLKAGQTNQ